MSIGDELHDDVVGRGAWHPAGRGLPRAMVMRSGLWPDAEYFFFDLRMRALGNFLYGLRSGAVGVFVADEGARLVVCAGLLWTEDVNDFTETDGCVPKLG